MSLFKKKLYFSFSYLNFPKIVFGKRYPAIFSLSLFLFRTPIHNIKQEIYYKLLQIKFEE